MSTATVAAMVSPIGDRIKAAREREGWSQTLLARQAGVTRQWVSQAESGETENPGIDKLGLIARALHVDITYLLHGATSTGVPVPVPADDVAQVRRFIERPKWLRDYLDKIADLALENMPSESDGNQRESDR